MATVSCACTAHWATSTSLGFFERIEGTLQTMADKVKVDLIHNTTPSRSIC